MSKIFFALFNIFAPKSNYSAPQKLTGDGSE